MATKKIEIRDKASNYVDVLYPKTSIDMVDGLQSALNGKSNTHDHPYATTSAVKQAYDLADATIQYRGIITALSQVTKTGVYYVGIGDSSFPYAYGMLTVKYYNGEWVATYDTTGDSRTTFTNVKRSGATSWNEWVKVYTSNNKPTANDVGAMSKTAVNDNSKFGKYVDFYDYDDNGAEGTKKRAYLRDGKWVTTFSEMQIGSTNVVSEITNLKSSVSSGKSAVASAITGKGVSASGSDDFATLANKIGQISSMSLRGVNDLLILFLDNAFTNGSQINTTIFDYMANMCTVYFDSASAGNFKQIYLPANTLCYVTGTYITANAYGKRYYKSGTNNKAELMFSTRSDFRVQPYNSSESITIYTLDLNKFVK